MRLPPSLISLALMGLTGVAADELVTPGRVKVFLFASPAFISEVSVDAYDSQCLSLDNNLIDGRVQSFLVGGQDVAQVLTRTDLWYCNFYDNYDCAGDESQRLTFPDGVNNLGSVGWGTRIHSLRCFNPARKSR